MAQKAIQLQTRQHEKEQKNKNINLKLVAAKEIIDKAIMLEWKRKWDNTPHYKHIKHFDSGPDKNRTKKRLNIS